MENVSEEMSASQEVVEGDVLRSKWPVFDVCAANLPYQAGRQSMVHGMWYLVYCTLYS